MKYLNVFESVHEADVLDDPHSDAKDFGCSGGDWWC